MEIKIYNQAIDDLIALINQRLVEMEGANNFPSLEGRNGLNTALEFARSLKKPE